jgi:hypothetical protein
MFDRRKFVRFRVPENEFNLICQNSSTIGWLKDIGYLGLSYEYFADEKRHAELEEIGIFSDTNRGVFIQGLTCKVVYDIKSEEEPGSYSVFNFRLRGLKYKTLTNGQMDRLVYLINRINVKSTEIV